MYQNNYQGGYPYGYPPQYNNQQYPYGINPNSNYSPFINPPVVNAPVDNFVPGGQIVVPQTTAPPNGIVPGSIPQSQQIQMDQQNGYYNPYNQYAYTPNYNNQPYLVNTGFGYNGNPAFAYMQTGYTPYGYGWNANYYQQQLDRDIDSELYGNTISGIDPFECVRDSILTDEEKEKRKRNIAQYQYYDYYGNLQMGNAYNRNQLKTEELERARKEYIDFFTLISMAAHNYCGDDVDEEELRNKYDPIKPLPKQTNYYSLDDEQKQLYYEYQIVERAATIPIRVAEYDRQQQAIAEKRASAYKKIKDSHDKALGINEGEDITLDAYLQNAGKLYADALVYEQRRRDKDASKKYSNSSFRQLVGNVSGKDIPIASISDEYVPLEQRLKDRYQAQKQKFVMDLNGSLTPTVPPPPSPYDEARNAFVSSVLKGVSL